MKKTEFKKCILKETDFIDTDLTGSNFAGSDLTKSKFQNSNLEKSNFVGATNYIFDPSNNKIKKAKFSAPEVLALLKSFDITIE